jgi:hypothetical protein
VRLARWLLDGVRAGQPLAVLLGYRIERALHAQRLDRYIAPFRRLAPLASTPSAPAEPSESVAASNVVHGLELLRMWKAPDPRFQALRTSVTIADFITIDAELRAIDGVVDALGDVLMAENVYQVVQGNFSRVGASLDLVAQGETLPEPEVLQTPRTGVGLTHRVVVLFGGNPPAATGWRIDDRHVRAAAEPQLNGWVASILGDPTRVRCRAEYVDARSGTPVPDGGPREVRLADLELSPLDVVSMPPSAAGSQEGELERRLTYHLLRTRPANVPPDARVRLDYGRDPAWPADVLGIAELSEVARTVSRLLTGSRALTAADLALPEEPPVPAVDLAELRGRADAAAAALRQAHADLTALLEAGDAADPEALRAVLLRLGYFGFLGAVPVSATGTAPADRSALLEQARALDPEAARRIRAITAAETGFGRATASEDEQRDHDVERLRLVLGADFPVLPRFTPPNAAEVMQAFRASDTLLGGNAQEAITWFTRVARVREGAERLADVLRLADALGRSAGGAFTVGQLPFEPDARWVALPPAPGSTLPPGRVSLVALAPVAPSARRPVAGLMVDEWSEVVPSASETTGVAFHYDEPGARAPQAILLAVAPDTTRPWDLEALEAIVFETLELAKLRTVDGEAMVELDHFLPALCFAINPAGDTVSTSFRE